MKRPEIKSWGLLSDYLLFVECAQFLFSRCNFRLTGRIFRWLILYESCKFIIRRSLELHNSNTEIHHHRHPIIIYNYPLTIISWMIWYKNRFVREKILLLTASHNSAIDCVPGGRPRDDIRKSAWPGDSSIRLRKTRMNSCRLTCDGTRNFALSSKGRFFSVEARSTITGILSGCFPWDFQKFFFLFRI